MRSRAKAGEVDGAKKSQARCGAWGSVSRGRSSSGAAAPERAGERRPGQRGEAKPGGTEWAPVAGWRYRGDGVWRRTSEGSSWSRAGEARGARALLLCVWRCRRTKGRGWRPREERERWGSGDGVVLAARGEKWGSGKRVVVPARVRRE